MINTLLIEYLLFFLWTFESSSDNFNGGTIIRSIIHVNVLIQEWCRIIWLISCIAESRNSCYTCDPFKWSWSLSFIFNALFIFFTYYPSCCVSIPFELVSRESACNPLASSSSTSCRLLFFFKLLHWSASRSSLSWLENRHYNLLILL